MSNKYSDPIYKLVGDIGTRHKLSDSWLEEWGKNGQDPVATAWQTSTNIEYMLTLIKMLKVNMGGINIHGDRWLNAANNEIKTGPNTILKYSTSYDGFSEEIESIFEYKVDNQDKVVGEGLRKTVEDFANAIRDKTKGQITLEKVNNYLTQ